MSVKGATGREWLPYNPNHTKKGDIAYGTKGVMLRCASLSCSYMITSCELIWCTHPNSPKLTPGHWANYMIVPVLLSYPKRIPVSIWYQTTIKHTYARNLNIFLVTYFNSPPAVELTRMTFVVYFNETSYIDTNSPPTCNTCYYINSQLTVLRYFNMVLPLQRVSWYTQDYAQVLPFVMFGWCFYGSVLQLNKLSESD